MEQLEYVYTIIKYYKDYKGERRKQESKLYYTKGGVKQGLQYYRNFSVEDNFYIRTYRLVDVGISPSKGWDVNKKFYILFDDVNKAIVRAVSLEDALFKAIANCGFDRRTVNCQEIDVRM